MSSVAQPAVRLEFETRLADISAQLISINSDHLRETVESALEDAVDDPGSPFLGQRLKNGWKNSGSPWTYDLSQERMSLPKVP